jgi:dihydroxyacetone kinase-like protein
MEMLIESAIESVRQNTKKNARMNRTKEILNGPKNVVPGLPEGLADAYHGEARKLDGVNAVLKPKLPKDKVGLLSRCLSSICARRGRTGLFCEGLSWRSSHRG